MTRRLSASMMLLAGLIISAACSRVGYQFRLDGWTYLPTLWTGIALGALAVAVSTALALWRSR